MKLRPVVLLVGSPNSGKTTLFNTLTGSNARTGNWAGVTVEASRTNCDLGEGTIELVDLPGCYDLDPNGDNSLDEQVAHEHLCSGKADIILNVINANHLERQLYLTLQLLEQQIPVVVVLSQTHKSTTQIDPYVLQQALGCPVLTVTSELKQRLLGIIGDCVMQARVSHGSSEGNEIVKAQRRYQKIKQIVEKSCQPIELHDKKNMTEVLDTLILNRLLGIPIFLGLMYLLFMFSVHVSGVFQDFFDLGSKAVFVDGVYQLMQQVQAPGWLTGLIAFGVGQGINITLSFIPVIAAMFFALSFLEASGYMARAAFVMDRVMRWFGLPGKAFVPMIVGFGCNVPAIMATRTLENRQERILTILMTPFMSCGARLAIYALFAVAFFPHNGQNVIFALYLIGIAVALFTAFILKRTLLEETRSSLIMELPDYRLPGLYFLCRTTWYRLKRFLLKAGLVIIPLCMIIGTTFSVQPGNTNFLSALGRKVTPIFAPMGIKADNWPATVGLLTGVLAKEVVVGTLNAFYIEEARSTEPVNVSKELTAAWQSIPANWSKLRTAFRQPLLSSMKEQKVDSGVSAILVARFGGANAAFAYLLFVLLYMPCVSVVATIARELDGAWAMFSVVWTTGIAYTTAVLFYQSSILFDNAFQSIGWIAGLLIMMSVAIKWLQRLGKKLANQPRRVPTPISVSQ